MGRHKRYGSPDYYEPGDQGDDMLRMFIRRNRKKLLIALGLGVVLLLVLIVTAVIFLFNVILPVGMEATNQLVESGQSQGIYAGIRDWLTGFVKNFDLSQLLSLLLLVN